jgi:hypothetical protein
VRERKRTGRTQISIQEEEEEEAFGIDDENLYLLSFA